MSKTERRPAGAPAPMDLGPLPVEGVNARLGLALPPARVHFSTRAQLHAAQRHPREFEICLRRIEQIIARPHYIGRSPHQIDGFELIGGDHDDGMNVLVAIKIRLDAKGRYNVASTYLIDRDKLARRLRKNFVKPW